MSIHAQLYDEYAWLYEYVLLYEYAPGALWVCITVQEGTEFKDFNLGFRPCTFLCTTSKCNEILHKIWDSVHKIGDYQIPLNSQPDKYALLCEYALL